MSRLALPDDSYTARIRSEGVGSEIAVACFSNGDGLYRLNALGLLSEWQYNSLWIEWGSELSARRTAKH